MSVWCLCTSKSLGWNIFLMMTTFSCLFLASPCFSGLQSNCLHRQRHRQADPIMRNQFGASDWIYTTGLDARFRFVASIQFCGLSAYIYLRICACTPTKAVAFQSIFSSALCELLVLSLRHWIQYRMHRMHDFNMWRRPNPHLIISQFKRFFSNTVTLQFWSVPLERERGKK